MGREGDGEGGWREGPIQSGSTSALTSPLHQYHPVLRAEVCVGSVDLTPPPNTPVYLNQNTLPLEITIQKTRRRAKSHRKGPSQANIPVNSTVWSPVIVFTWQWISGL